jgi:C-terminal processing protease CtpA/Prc
MYVKDEARSGESTEIALTNDSSDENAAKQPASSWSEADDNKGHIQMLEEKITGLEMRIIELEQTAELKPEAETAAPPSKENVRANWFNRALTSTALVKAGISEDVAADIVRRKNDLELRKLQLRDRATREGYANTARFLQEMTELMAEKTTLREDLGDATYDRYLYANKRPNRVVATSVMEGSAAELAGMKDGDIILTYGQLKVYGWNELKKSTLLGELDEYVSVDILREGQLMSLWMPRGPLGVRLGTARVEPGE